MRTTRLGITITFTPPNAEGIDQAHDPEDMLHYLQEAMQNVQQANFKVWHQMAGHIEEDGEPSQETIEACDRAINFQMNADTAKTILSHPQTIQAMLLTFGQILAKQNTPQAEGEVAGEAMGQVPGGVAGEAAEDAAPEPDPDGDDEDPGLSGEGGELVN